jgi:hypothetical protein
VPNPDPYEQTIACTGDDGYGMVKATSQFGNLYFEATPYPGKALQRQSGLDIPLGPCERARIVVPSKLPSGH